MKKQFYALAALFMMSFAAQAQVGIGTPTPSTSAMLDITSTTKGFLMPRMTTTDRTSIVTPAAGLQVYDTTTNTTWYFNGTVWVNSGINAVEPWFNQTTGLGATSNTQNIYQMGNVGIGTTTPAQKLDVSGTALLRGGGDAGSITGTQLLLGYSGQSNFQHAIKTRHDANASATTGNAIDFYVWTPTDAPSAQPTRNVMTINGQGNVGIGTSTPLTHLHVNGPAGGSGGAAQITLSNSLPSAVNTSYNLGRIGFTAFDGSTISSGSNAPVFIGAIPTEGWSASSHGAALYFYTTLNASITPTERMRIDNNGNVGIGTSAPANRLEVTSASASTSGIRMTNLTTTVTTKASSAATLGVNNGGDIVIASNAASTAAKNFIYMPSIAIDVSANVTGATKNLYSLYSAQFTTPKAASSGAPASIPVLPAATDFYYYVTYADPAVFTGAMSIDASGVLTYNVTASAVTDATFINIILVPKN